MQQPEWERSKENVCPLREGRDPQVLNAALATTKSDLASVQATHEKAVKEALKGQGPHASDPLTPWVSYTKWALETHPAGSHVIISSIERACRLYSKDTRYLEDPRFVRLWVRYAELRHDRLDVYDYMRRRKIGKHASLFYEAYAAALEISRKYEEAEGIYRLGKEGHAKPIERLVQREKEYFNRMAARARRAERKKQEKEVAQMVDTTRAEARAARNHSHGATSSSMRERTSIAASAASKDENARVRKALGDLSEREARSSHRPLVTSSDARTSRKKKSSGKAENVPAQQQRAFSVYADGGRNKGGLPMNDDDNNDDGLRRSVLPTRDEVMKEDSGPLPTKWAGETLPQDGALQKRRSAQMRAAPSFDVYRGEEEDDSDDENAAPQDEVNTSSLASSGLAQSSSTREQQRQANHHAAKPPVVPLGDREASPVRRSSAKVSSLHVTSPTINTKQAIQEVDDMFNTTLPMERVCRVDNDAVVSSIAPNPPKFEVFQGDDDDDFKENDGISEKPVVPLSSIPEAEKRVLQPLSELEGRPDGDYVVVEEEIEGGKAAHDASAVDAAPSGSLDLFADARMIEFFLKWTKEDSSSYHLLKNSDPTDLDEMFDLEPERGDMVSLNPFCICKGHDTSCTVLAEDLNGIYGTSRVSVGAGSDDDSDDDEPPSVAVKMSKPTMIWEYYVYRTLHQRLSSSVRTIPRALSYYEGHMHAYMVLDKVSLASLKEGVSKCGDNGLPESLSLLFVADLLRALVSVHEAGVIHNDVSMSNVLYRQDGEEISPGCAYDPNGGNGWVGRGVLLVDFNHAIDTRHWCVGGSDARCIAAYARTCGQHFRDNQYLVQGNDGWGFNVDCLCAAQVAAELVGMPSASALVDGSGAPTNGRVLAHADMWRTVATQLTSLGALSSANETKACMLSCIDKVEAALRKERALTRELVQFATVLGQGMQQDSVIWK